jgi:hypothetical protein
VKRRAKPKGTSIAGAEKKLRQAEFFLAWLEETSKEYQGGIPRGGANDAERLEFYFSACLTATRSVRYVLKATYDPKFKDVEKKWRKGLSNDSLARFDWMIGVRDDDVHFATTGAKPLQKYVKEEPWQTRSRYSFQFHNAPLGLGGGETLRAMEGAR